MKVHLGEKGLDKTWQQDWDKEINCVHCGYDSRIAFVAIEKKEKEYICDLYDNEGGKGGDYWVHDACAVAVYFCKNCLLPTALMNQA